LRVSTFFSKRTPLAAVLLAAAMLIALFTLHKQETIRLLYATNGDSYDPSAYDQFRQSAVANLTVERRDWNGLSARQLERYDAVYLDPGLHTPQGLPGGAERLAEYVRKGGHLFLENVFAADVPLQLIGASRLVPVRSAAAKPAFSYPPVDFDLRPMQDVFRLFSDNFFKRATMDDLPGFAWGTGMKPSTALTLVALDGVSIATVNAYGNGSVLLSSAFLPNRYFITGDDLQSGMDPAAGFPTLVKQFNEKAKPVQGSVYFDKTKLPLEPFFHFAFSAANAQYRTEYVSFVSKRKYGLTVKKVLGPYGRPAMAFQNHFEAMPAIRDRDGIQWAEMLKQYREIPSFSLVRSTYEWGLWQETVSAQLNTGTSAQPKFRGEAPNSFYGSGTHLFAVSGAGAGAGGGTGAGAASGGSSAAGAGTGAVGDGARANSGGASANAASGGSAGTGAKVITGAKYPQYKELAGTIDLPYRASPAFLDVNGDGRADLLLGSADGSVSVYANLGPEPAASGTAEAVPAGVAPPDRFAAPQPLRLAGAGSGAGAVYRAPSYAALAVARAAGAPPSLLVGDGSGHVSALALGAGGRFSPPAQVLAGGRPVQVPGPAAPAFGDVDGDGIPDLVVGDGEGRVWFYRGLDRSAPLRFAAGAALLQIPARFAAPALRDMNGDGLADLVVGGNEGDLLVYVQDAPAPGAVKPAVPHFTAKGPLTGETLNQMGTPALVGGHNSAPVWFDINHDGKDDLVVGQLEFGVPYAIDDPEFPYRAQLDDFIQYAKTNGLEIYPHLFVHNFTSSDAERQEFALHKQAFERLGLPWGNTGTNQHTWRINIPDRQQTLRNEAEEGLWFNFGFKPSHVPDDPRLGSEYIWGLPFLLQPAPGAPAAPQPMLLYTPAPVLRFGEYSTEDIFQSFVALDMPIDYFEHIEPFFPANTEGLREFAAYFDKLRTEHDYNFMSEPQMARSFLTALTARVTVERSWAACVQDKLKDLILGTKNGPHLSLRLKPDFSGVPSQAGPYRTTLGVSIERGERLQLYRLGTDGADIYNERDGKLYLGLDRPLTLGVRALPDRLHLLRSNVPVAIERGAGAGSGSGAPSGEAWTLHLNDSGMQQIKLYSPQPVDVQGGGADVRLDIQRDEAAHTVTVTHYGPAVALRIVPR
jgi:hypothetical protein